MENILEIPTLLKDSELISSGINAVGNTHFPKNMKNTIIRTMILRFVLNTMNDEPADTVKQTVFHRLYC